MEHANGFLDKYKNLTPPDGVTRRAVVDVLNSTLGATLSLKNVRVHNNIVWLDVSPATKNTVAIHKKKLLSKLQKHLGETHAPTDIR